MNLQRIIWLASFPKSGNTWLRSFLAQYFTEDGKAPDINSLKQFTTADVRQDFFDRAAGRRFEARDFDDWLRTRVKAVRLIAGSKPGHHFVKTHCQVLRIGPIDVIEPAVTAAAIHVLRNPFDVAPSYARHLGITVDEAINKMLEPKALNATDTKIFEIVGRWDDHATSWAGSRGLQMHRMRYEDMKADPERAFRALLGFLKAPVQDGKLRRALRETSFEALRKQEDIKGFVERPAGMDRFFAKGQAGAWREDLTPAQVSRLREGLLPAIQRWYPELVEETAEVAARA